MWSKLFAVLAILHVSTAYNILGVFLIPGPSHYICGSSLMKGLANQGHNVTFLSPFQKSPPTENYREIEISGIFSQLSGFDFLSRTSNSKFSEVRAIHDLGLLLTEYTLQEKNFRQVLDTQTNFDVIVVEIFQSDALVALGRHFNAPVVGVNTFSASPWTDNLSGNPSPLSFVSHPFLTYTDQMNFFERIENTLVTVYEEWRLKYVTYPQHERLLKAALPHINVSLEEILRNDVKVTLINTHFTLAAPRPYLPNVIEVGGMHIDRKTQELPEDLQKLLDDAKDRGVVYFSLGSNIQCKDLTVEKRTALIDAFKKLPQLVLWKWEADELPGKPDNVVIRKWFPQAALLAHPSVKLFVTHGGLLSTTESIFHAKPVIGITVFGDQMLNMNRAEKAGYGVQLDFTKLNEKDLSAALQKVLGSKEIAKNIKLASARYRDQPLTPLETAIYWVEYVVRHDGAPHLQSAARNLDFVQYHNLDVILSLLAGVLLVLWVAVKIVMKVVGLIGGTPKKVKKQ